jgi:nucleoid-associated protein YgaU
MARGTKIALAFLLVLFVGTGIYFTLTAPSPNPSGDLSSGGLTADGGVGTLSPADSAFPETIVLGPTTPEGSAIEVINPPAGSEIDIFNEPAVEPSLANSETPDATGLTGTGTPAPAATGPGAVVLPEPAAVAPATTTYTVASGDTLGGIAKKTYGKETAWTAIQAANPGVNPNNLKVGTVLQLPAADQLPAGEQVAAAGKSRGATRASTPPAKKGGSKSTGTTGRRYTVKNGDTLWKIAKAEYGTATKANVDRIREANSIGSDGALKAGQSLTIPAK